MNRREYKRDRRGYFAIGIEHTKTPQNLGTLMRSATLYGAAFVFTVGARYEGQASDTVCTPRHTPLFRFTTIDDLLEHLPDRCPLVGIEMTEDAKAITDFHHPERACYLLGAEDHGLSKRALEVVHHTVFVETLRPESLNVSVAGSIVLHDRFVSRKEYR